MHRDLVSVIVPTYNRQKMWGLDGGDNCLILNLLNQTYPNLEIIIVNDGSTDETSLLLDKWKERDSRIKIINKENGGLSSSRNAGIEEAKGEYIFFIDDDDNIPLDYIESFMIPENEGIDLLMDSFSQQDNQSQIIKVNFEEKEFKDRNPLLTHLFRIMVKGYYPFFAHGKRFKKSVIKENNLTFLNDRRIIEDRPFVLDYIKCTSSFKITNNHKYLVNNDSSQDYRLSQSVRPIEKWWEVFRNGYEYLNKYAAETGHDEIREYANNYLATKVFYYIFKNLNSHYKNKKKYFTKNILPYLKTNLKIKNVPNRNIKLIYSIVFIIGLNIPLILIKFK